jgi:hypothetical protein
LPLGRIVDATVTSVIERTNGLHLQVDYGLNQTALVVNGRLYDDAATCLSDSLCDSPDGVNRYGLKPQGDGSSFHLGGAIFLLA